MKRRASWLFTHIPVPSWLLVLLTVDVCHNVLIARVLYDIPERQRHASPLFLAMERAASINVYAYALGVWSAFIIAGALLRRSRVAALGCVGTFIWWANVGTLLVVKTPMISYFVPTLFLLPLTIPLVAQVPLWSVRR